MMDFAGRRARLGFSLRALWAAGVFATALAIAVRPAAAQQALSGAPRGSRIIATTDWMTDVVSRLRGRGYFASLSPLAQPWDRLEVARDLARVPIAALDTMPRHVAHWFRLLRVELGPELRRIEGAVERPMGFVAWAGTTTATSPRIDPFFPLRTGIARPNGQRGRGAPWSDGGAGGWAERGAFAVDLRVGWDLALRRGDPDGRFPRRLFDVLPDNEISYASVRFADGGFVVGRIRRNWAPVGTKGLMVSDAAIGIPQIGYDLGGRHMVLRGFVGELDTLQGRDRYVAAHRLEYLRENFAISIGESKVFVPRNGLGIGVLNPVEIFFITGDKLGGEEFTNTALDGQLWLRRGRLTLAGETFVDDVWVTYFAPPRVAISASGRYVGPASWIELGLDYRIVTAFTYATGESHLNIDQMTFHGRGLGDNFSDYDRITLQANLYPRVPGLRVTPTIARQRKGEWDFRLAGVPDSVWKQQETLLRGTIESMTRIALAGRYQPTRRGFAEWDAGVNLVSNANHVAGNKLSEFSAVFRIGVMWSAPNDRFP